ncbi:Endonuclease/exonuclease/phosphatase [Quillaja saponaria]|uniref:Endonuclease/exonuclease/phosphatase n=1 Tax=Quillaja saponaria TaxID=32244 RepID=A0AAD7PGW9_QUISA|nr:Endonuclease/exonuclease/phosphatase [Quillaja saponaria]
MDSGPDDLDLNASHLHGGPGEISKPWRNALIVKLLGKSLSYNYLLDRLKQRWNTRMDPRESVSTENGQKFQVDETLANSVEGMTSDLGNSIILGLHLG